MNKDYQHSCGCIMSEISMDGKFTVIPCGYHFITVKGKENL